MNFLPEPTGIGKYSGEMAEWLSKSGYDVRVIAAPPYYPNWERGSEYSSLQYKKEIFKKIEVYRCPLYIPKKPSGLKRIIHLFSFAISSFPVAIINIFWKPDLVICVEPPFFCTPAALIISKLSKSKSWLHIQDFELDAGINLGIIPNVFNRVIFCIEKFIFSHFDIVSTISESMKKKLDAKGVSRDSQILFQNWSDLDKIFPNIELGKEFRLNNGFDNDDFIVLYSGNMGEKQGLEAIINSAIELKNIKKIKFVLCGDGVKKSFLQNLVAKNNLSNCFFLPLQEIGQFNKMLNSASVHLVLQKAEAADLVMPSKLTNIIAVGGFSIVSAELGTELGNIFDFNKFLGIRIDPNDKIALSIALKNIFEKNGSIDKLSIRNYAEKNFEAVSVLSEFEERVRDIL
jgi:colanic acid biosynthesis glycosyl transferase WcaI